MPTDQTIKDRLKEAIYKIEEETGFMITGVAISRKEVSTIVTRDFVIEDIKVEGFLS